MLIFNNLQQKLIFNICITKWIKHLYGYHHSLLLFPYIIEPLKMNQHKLHEDKYPNNLRRKALIAVAGKPSFKF